MLAIFIPFPVQARLYRLLMSNLEIDCSSRTTSDSGTIQILGAYHVSRLLGVHIDSLAKHLCATRDMTDVWSKVKLLI